MGNNEVVNLFGYEVLVIQVVLVDPSELASENFGIVSETWREFMQF
jgi:hypothetical protein